METLRDQTNAESLTEVVRRSLAVYDFLLTRKKEGAKLMIEEDGKKTELVLL
jgi:hypothetical protein